MQVTEVNVEAYDVDSLRKMVRILEYINIYLITGRNCYLIDSGVAGSEILIEEYLRSIGRKISDIKGIFLTHSHPDHTGAAAEIKRQTGCRIYAPRQEIPWIENVRKQFEERPIPNFFRLLPESVKVDQPLKDGDVIEPEEGILLRALSTPGHSHGSMCYILNRDTIFTGDAIPETKDFPIAVDLEESIRSLDRLRSLTGIRCGCPAWDHVYTDKEWKDVLAERREMLFKKKEAAAE